MRYLSVIKGPENIGVPPQGLMQAMDQLVAESLKNGTVISTGGLAATARGTRVRIRDRKIHVIDGPFTETKEVIGGYAIIQAPTREAAIENTVAFMRLHVEHWPEWEGECELRELVFLAP
jgi:hypothetical protein